MAGAPTQGDPLQAVDGLCATDVYLACAAGLDVPGARELFVRRYLEPIAGAVRSIDPAPAFVDEVRQALHESLLLGGKPGDGDPGPRILQYAGRAPLSSWVGVAAQRTALGLLRADGARRRAIERAAEEPLPVDLDPELQYLKDRYRDAFKDALTAALGRLSQRHRTVIKLHTLSGLTLARIGAMLGVDESTVVPLDSAGPRGRSSADTHRELGAALGLRIAEVPSLARLVQSQLDVSVARSRTRPAAAASQALDEIELAGAGAPPPRQAASARDPERPRWPSRWRCRSGARRPGSAPPARRPRL